MQHGLKPLLINYKRYTTKHDVQGEEVCGVQIGAITHGGAKQLSLMQVTNAKIVLNEDLFFCKNVDVFHATVDSTKKKLVSKSIIKLFSLTAILISKGCTI